VRPSLPIRSLLALLAAAVALLACAAPAMAGRAQESFFQDDRLLTNSDYPQQALSLDALAKMGVDTIHTVVNWRRFAPQPDSRTKPVGFDATDSAAYGATNWDIYDSLVRGAQARGISVMMSPSGPVPTWASRCRRNLNSACRPDPTMYREFVTAIASRYSGSHVDEDQDQTALPRVARWSPWNEPNLGAWLYPQTKGRRGHRVSVGAAYYRRLVYAMRSALDSTGHGRDLFLIGELAPLGGGATRTPPADFLRQLFCMDDRGKRLRGRAEKQQGCRKAKRIKADGISHHPYSRGAGVPTSPKQRKGAITMGTIGRLLPIIRAARHSRVAPRKLPVYLTEFGVTTRPPDRKFGVPLGRQAEYLNLVDFLAFKRPWIKSVSQFQLVDDTGLAERGTFQTGLIFRTGVAKPSFQAYRIPIFVLRRRAGVTVFGQIRPIRAGTARPKIGIQNRQRGKDWRTVTTRRTNSRGYVLVKLKRRTGSWRLRWVEPDGTISFSRGSASVPGSTPSTPGLPPPGSGTPPSPEPPSSDPGTPPPAPEEPPPAPPAAQFTLTVAFTLHDDVLMRHASGHVTSAPSGIDCMGGTSGCNATYSDGTSVTLTAVPDAGSTFDGWTGEGCSGTSTCVVPMSQARSVTASFTHNFP
jgi:Divergent InlB B-repeat domain